MENQGFIKSSELTGAQKAAIFLAEVGPLLNDHYDELFKAMKLKPKEMKRIRMAMKSLQPYLKSEPKNIMEIYREQNVLESALRFGEVRGIYKPVEKVDTTPSYLKNDKSGFGKIVAENPESIARILGDWLND